LVKREFGPRYFTWYRDNAVSWMIERLWFSVWWGEEIFLLIRDLDWLWGPATLSSVIAGGTAAGE